MIPLPQKSALAVGTGTMMIAMHMSAVSAALPLIVRQSGIRFGSAQWLLILYTLVLTSWLVTFGRLGDQMGLKPVYLTGLVIFTLSSGLIAIPAPVGVLLILRAIQGAGAAMVSATSLALLSRGLSFSEYSKAIGWQTAMTYAGLSVGPLLSGFVAVRFGWRAIFLFNLPLGLIAILVAQRILDGPSWRWLPWTKLCSRSGLAWIAIVSLILFALNPPHDGIPLTRPALSLLAVSVAAGIGFLALGRCATLPSPLFPGLLGAPFWSIAATETLCYLCLYGITFMAPFYLLNVRSFGAVLAGFLISCQYIARGLSAVVSGHLTARLGTRSIRICGCAILAFSLLGLSRLDAQSSGGLTAMLLACVGIGLGLFVPANSSAILVQTSVGLQGMATGVLATARNLGMTLGVAIAAAAYAGYHTGPFVGIAGWSGMRETIYVLTSFAILNVLITIFVGFEAVPRQDSVEAQ